ncbi:hypothetical protein P301_J30891 [Saccharomyces cerevisiae P301]|nr:hypothetical protein P301_J30891 [Saccharomyces cerevisiae P301]
MKSFVFPLTYQLYFLHATSAPLLCQQFTSFAFRGGSLVAYSCPFGMTARRGHVNRRHSPRFDEYGALSMICKGFISNYQNMRGSA